MLFECQVVAHPEKCTFTALILVKSWTDVMIRNTLRMRSVRSAGTAAKHLEYFSDLEVHCKLRRRQS